MALAGFKWLELLGYDRIGGTGVFKSGGTMIESWVLDSKYVALRQGCEQILLFRCDCGDYVPEGRICEGSKRIIHNDDTPHFKVTCV